MHIWGRYVCSNTDCGTFPRGGVARPPNLVTLLDDISVRNQAPSMSSISASTIWAVSAV